MYIYRLFENLINLSIYSKIFIYHETSAIDILFVKSSSITSIPIILIELAEFAITTYIYQLISTTPVSKLIFPVLNGFTFDLSYITFKITW